MVTITSAIVIVSAFGLWSQLPQGDLAALFNAAILQEAINSGRMNLMGVMLCSFGIGAGSHVLVTTLGRRRGGGDFVARVGVFTVASVVIGVLVIGVAADLLTGITIPAVMTVGSGLLIGSFLGWRVGLHLA
jgi:hypothetical protein